MSAKIYLHSGDLPDGVDFGAAVAVDTETLGLNPERDRLCLVQLSAGDGRAHLVQFSGEDYGAPNLRRLLCDVGCVKIFHYARFDLAVLSRWLGVRCEPVWCTKVASKIARTYSERHGLKDLCEELLGVKINKSQQSSDWGAGDLSDAQRQYAANDVLYLHRLRETLAEMLKREGRDVLARECFNFLPTRARLDLLGWNDDDHDVFKH